MDILKAEELPEYMLHEAVKDALHDCDLEYHRGIYTFHCPICGGHKKNRNNKCGYIYTNKWQYNCYNECGSMSFMWFLKKYNPDIYKKLSFLAYTDTDNNKDKVIDYDKSYKSNDLYKFKDGELIELSNNLNPYAIEAKKYCISRKIPESVYMKWFFCIEDPKFFNRTSDGKLIFNEYNYPTGNEYKNRIIIPYYRYGGDWNQFDARSIEVNPFRRYRNLESAERELYNIDFVDFTKPFFLLEGSIDSCFIKNSIAFGGTQHLKKFLVKYPELINNAKNGTVIWDNDSAGYDEIEKTVNLGFNWFEWTDIKPTKEFMYDESGNVRHIKDINNAVMYSDALRTDNNGFIITDDLLKYVKKADGALIKLRLLYGNREKLKLKKHDINMHKYVKDKESIAYF